MKIGNSILYFNDYILNEEMLLENRMEFIKKQYKDNISTEHDQMAQHKSSDDIITHFATHADPTRNKAHTQWILNRYKNKDFRQEDHPRIKTALENFDKHKSKLPEKDINKYTSLSSVEDAVQPHLGEVSKKEEKRQIKSEGADLIHSGNGVTVHHIKTEKAACAYGAGTKWCTAAENHNMFNNYNKDGNIHVIQHEGRKYQFHTKSLQFMDEKDRDVTFKDVHPDIAKELSKSNHPDIQHANLLFKNPHTTSDAIDAGLKDESHGIRVAAIRHPNATSEHINKALSNENVGVRKTAIENPKATSEHITKALNDTDPSVRYGAILHPNATLEHITQALNDKDDSMREYAIRHSKVTPDLITQALNDKRDGVRRSAIKNKKATPEHINIALDDKDPETRQSAITHPNATTENVTKAIKNKDEMVNILASMHPKSTPEHISNSMKNDNVIIRRYAIKNPRATSEHINSALDDKDSSVRFNAMHNSNATPDNIHKALDDKDHFVRVEAIKHPNATPDNIHKALDDKEYMVREKAILHPNATPDNINKALDDRIHFVRSAAIRHPNATPDNIKKVLNDKDDAVRQDAIRKQSKLKEEWKMTKIKEDYRTLTQDIDVEDENVKTQINSLLSQALSEPFLTPYMALEKINKILIAFHITVPSATILDGDHGYKVFGVSQFGTKFGMTNAGETLVKNEGTSSVFIEYGMNEEGTFDIFCEIVNPEELEEIMRDIEDEKDPSLQEEDDEYPLKKEGLQKRSTLGLAKVKKLLGKTAKIKPTEAKAASRATKFARKITPEKKVETKGLDQRIADVSPPAPKTEPKPRQVFRKKASSAPKKEPKPKPTPHADRTDRFDTAWNQSIKTVGAPHLKHSENNHYHPENLKLMHDHARADLHSMTHGKGNHTQEDIDNFHHRTKSLIKDATHHWTSTANFDDIEKQVSRGNVDPDPTILKHMHAAAKVEYSLDSDKAKHDNRIEKVNRLSSYVHGTTEKKGWFGKRTITPNKVFKEEVSSDMNISYIKQIMDKQYKKL